jgi:galactokinase
VAGEALSARALLIRAPGRVNLIGEHTDYNDGFVMPIAIDRYTEVRATPRSDRKLLVRSAGIGATAEISLDELPDTAPGEWSRYVSAVAWALRDAGHVVAGAELEIHSTVPAGAGLSSSAALEVCCAYALLRLAGVEPDRTALALLCQRAENEYVGARCGIMDQYIACQGRAGHALLLDCRTLEHRHVPLRFRTSAVRIVVCNSMVRHALAGGEYNERRAQCEAGVRHLARRRPDIRALRDVDTGELQRLSAGMDPIVLRRCRHVVGENLRVLAAAETLIHGDAPAFGALMYASHSSLRDDYEVSCRELDLLVELARGLDGVLGARMTGGGFGGCTVNLVRAEAIAPFTAAITTGYHQATGRTPQVFVCEAADGVSECR